MDSWVVAILVVLVLLSVLLETLFRPDEHQPQGHSAENFRNIASLALNDAMDTSALVELLLRNSPA